MGRRAASRCQERNDFRPVTKRPHRLKIRARRGIGRDAHFRKSTQHHQRIVRATAEALCAREEVHQARVAGRTRLHGPPGQIVKSFVVASLEGFKRELAARVPLAAVLGLAGTDVLANGPEHNC